MTVEKYATMLAYGNTKSIDRYWAFEERRGGVSDIVGNEIGTVWSTGSIDEAPPNARVQRT